VRPRKIDTILRKEKYEATFATLEGNIESNEMVIETRTVKSDLVFRLTIAARADALPTLANIQQWYHPPRTNCQKCNRNLQPTFAHILNGCVGNMTEMTRRHNKVIGVIRKAIEECMKEKSRSKMGDNIVIQEEDLSEEVRSLRPNLKVVTQLFGSSRTVILDISCASGRISSGANTLEKVCIDMKEERTNLAREISNIREMHVEIIPIIISSLGAVHARSLEALRNLRLSDDKAMKKIGRGLSEAAIISSIERWRKSARDMPWTENAGATRMTTQEVMIGNDKQANDQAEDNQEDQ
jgi:hypothetical protein